MLTNGFLLPYKEQKQISEFERNLLNQDENYRLNLERPMAVNQIRTIKQNKIHTFIDDIMCNNQVNTLLYSSNAKKELSFYLKQKRSLLKVVPLKNGIGYLSGGGKKTVKSFSIKQKQERMYENIKQHIESYKQGKSESLNFLKTKNYEFIKSQPKIEIKLSKLFFKPINEIRLKGYQKALNKCIDLSAKEKDFSMPNIGLDVKNVYSRLYNNYIFKNKRKKNKIKSKSALDINRRNNDFSGRSFNSGSKSSKRNSERYFYSAQNGKKIIKFKLKSNLGECEGKYFTIKITPKKLKRCWSNISGGPSVSREEEKKNDAKNRLKAKDILNYKILSYNNRNGDIKDMVLFNTMISNDPNLEEDFIKNKNYRDSENNSNLHIAVKNNSVELVKYFISKKYDLNDKNINGQTPLHLAIEGGNKEIIKLLIDNGADSNIKDNKGRKPIELAKKPKKQTKQF